MPREIHAITPGKIILIVLLLIVLVLAIYIFVPKETKTKENAPNLIHLKFDDIVQNNILFENIKIFKQNEEYYLKAQALNMTSNNLQISPVKIILSDNENKQIELISYIGNNLKDEEEKTITVKTDKNLKNIKKVDINISTQVLS